eukprot:6396282-Lingulodinium_polyedra.AAC.1
MAQTTKPAVLGQKTRGPPGVLGLTRHALAIAGTATERAAVLVDGANAFPTDGPPRTAGRIGPWGITGAGA